MPHEARSDFLLKLVFSIDVVWENMLSLVVKVNSNLVTTRTNCDDANGPICWVIRCWKISLFWRVMKGFFSSSRFNIFLRRVRFTLCEFFNGCESLISFEIILIVVHCYGINKARCYCVSAPQLNESKLSHRMKLSAFVFCRTKKNFLISWFITIPLLIEFLLSLRHCS